MDRKNSYLKNDHIAQSNLQIQCYFHQLNNDLHRIEKTHFKFHMELQESLHKQDNSE